MLYIVKTLDELRSSLHQFQRTFWLPQNPKLIFDRFLSRKVKQGLIKHTRSLTPLIKLDPLRKNLNN